MITFNTGTDAACIGIWKNSAMPIGRKPYKEHVKELEERAFDSELLYINTFADGQYSFGLLVDEEIDDDLLPLYKKINGYFSFKTDYSDIVFDGIEYLEKPDNASYVISIPHGFSEIEVYQHNIPEGDEDDLMRDGVSDKDLAYYDNKSQGCLVFIIWLIAGGVISFYTSTWLLIPAILIGFVFLSIYQKRNMKDDRYVKVEKHFNEWRKNHPAFIVIFKEVSEIKKSDGSVEIDF